jgi:hypothetical protein
VAHRRAQVRGAWARGWFGATVAATVLLFAPRVGAEVREHTRVPVAMSPQLARGRVEVVRFAIEGIPVRNAFEVVHTDPQGRARTIATRRPTATPDLAPADARIDAVEATRRAFAIVRSTAADPTPESPPELVYRVVLGVPVLAWEVQLPFSSRPEPTRKTLWISAASGALVDERENVFASRARVFAENPASTPEPIEVTLTDIDATGPGVPLAGPRVQSFNCVTTPPAAPMPWHDDGDCWAVARTFSDAAGDFFVPLPDPLDPTTGTDGDDLFAELSMYVHAERFMNVIAARGIPNYRCELSTMLANFRTLADDPGAPPDPLNNAYYTDQCDAEKGPTMLFGQGTDVDFAFDADVIYHELGHGLVAHVSAEGLGGSRKRADALVVDATAINEAIADYVSVMFQNDPDLAEYVGRFWVSQTSPYIRTARNGKRCPDDTIGQGHNDGEPLMGALWATRVVVGDALDAIVLASLARLPNDATLEEASAALLEVADEAVLAGELTATHRALLERELDARGIIDCPRVITDPEEVVGGRTMYLRKVSAAVEPFWPGPMQLRYRVPADAHELVVELDLDPRGSDDPPAAAVLVKRAADPIAFTYDLVARDDAGDPTGASGKVRELTLVGGDWDRRVEVERIADDAHRATIGGLQPGEVVHLALVATAEVDATATKVRIVDDVAAAGSSSDDDGGGEDDLREDVHGTATTATCACTATPRASDAWLLLLALLRRRRG